MHWITMLGVALIVVGTFLVFIRRNTGNRIGEYKKILSERNKVIRQLKARSYGADVPSSVQPANKQREVVTQVISEQDYNDIIAHARDLCKKGKLDYAYKIVDELRQKSPGYGLAYYVIGTIEIRKKRYDKGEALLNKAVKLVLSDKEKAGVFHNLGIASVRRKNIEKAKGFLEKAIKLNSSMEKSRKALDSLNNLQKKEKLVKDVKIVKEVKTVKDSKREKGRPKKLQVKDVK